MQKVNRAAPAYLCLSSGGRVLPLGRGGEVGLVHKHIAVCSATENILVVVGGNKMGDCSIVVVMHAEGPVSLQGGEREGCG